jgi:hypothetical protein
VDFEDSSWSSYLSIGPTSKKRGGVGSDRYEIQKEENGNSYMSITVKKGWGSDYGTNKNPTERSELETQKLQTFGKEVWYGFKVKVPSGHQIIRDRFLITQFKQRTRTRPSPMVCIYQYGPKDVRVGLSICGKSGGIGSYQTRSKHEGTRSMRCGNQWIEPVLNFSPTEEFKEFLTENWSNIVIGSYVTNKNDGFVQIYFNKELIYDYRGPTYGWSKIVGTNVRIGIYRDGDPFGDSYPPQTVHYDDFVIGSTQDEITNILWK